MDSKEYTESVSRLLIDEREAYLNFKPNNKKLQEIISNRGLATLSKNKKAV